MAEKNVKRLNKLFLETEERGRTGVRKTLFDKQFHDRNNRPGSLAELAENILFVQRKCGKHPLSTLGDISRLRRGDGSLNHNDYFLYQLYDDNKYTYYDKVNFISESLHWAITHQCCDMSWSALAEDKWLSYTFVKSFGIPVPETLAVVDSTLRSFGSLPKITSPIEFRDFIRGNNMYPIFAKPNIGLWSVGAFLISGSDNTHVMLEQSDPITFDKLFDDVIGERTYLLQSFVKNHATISGFSNYLATVRTVNLVKSDSVSTPFCMVKIPSSTNIADNFWRDGNIIADVDPESGVIRRAIRGKGINIEELDRHPETGGKLVGLELPYWNELRRVNLTCARLFAPLRYHTFDIALTQDGPVFIEVNTGGSFELPQLATGSGFLTEEVRNFLESCAWGFRNQRGNLLARTSRAVFSRLTRK